MSDKTSPHFSVSPFVRERSRSCTSLGGAERVIKIHPNPPHKHRPETTDFPITKDIVLGRLEVLHHCGACLAFRLHPKASSQPSHHRILTEGNTSPVGESDQRMTCTDVSWDPAPGKCVGLRQACFSSGQVSPPPS